MDFQDRRFVIGIDLGTTNSAVSYVDMSELEFKDGRRSIRIFKIPQLTGAGEFSSVPVLPSFLYIPGEYDISKDSIKHPWKKEHDSFAGVFAREHGAQVPSRLVSSAKSWLCHAKADRQARILPWGAENTDKISPVAATAEYLRHIKRSWNHSVKDEDDFLENQYVVITVPASFDESAREFTLEAAKEAGIGKHITLLEEPLAAFYCWLIKHESDWQEYVRPDDLILVCDVGGGTTDFTLITLKSSAGTPRFERVAVGDHLILGGDNIDLAIARFVESKFSKKQPLTSDRWKTLCHKCRDAKEKLLSKTGFESHAEEAIVDKVRITLKGEGSSLIAGTLAADLTKEELQALVCNGFFPEVEPSIEADRKRGKAIAEFGLPYEQEPAITRHIGWFLEKHRESIRTLLGRDPMPDFILFNGGALKPELIQNRIKGAIRKWFSIDNQAVPKILENSEPDLSVALGASYYGLVKQGTGVRVGSGSPRSYYIGISNQQDQSAEVCPEGGDCSSNHAMCIVERGLDEGSSIALPAGNFEVVANTPVKFSMFSSSFRSGDKSGDIIDVDDSLTQMAPLQTVIRFGKNGEKVTVPVKIAPEYTEMGTLAIWCISDISNHKWRLQFQLRDPLHGEIRDKEVLDSDLFESVSDLVINAFRDESGKNLQSLIKNLENAVSIKKNGWSLSLLRAIADALIEHANFRTNSPDHEIRWLNLTGFCMRPGFGDAFDQERIRNLWKVYLAGPQFPKHKQNSLEWWIFCRRIAGGLVAGQQRMFFQNITLYLLTDNSSKKKSCSAQELVEIWMAAANMERLIVKDKIALVKKLMTVFIKPDKALKQYLWALSRIGARELLYGSVDRVIPAKEIENWVRRFIKLKWSDTDSAASCISQLARKTGDRTRDLSDECVQSILSWFEEINVDRAYSLKLKEIVPIEGQDEKSIYGESLPQGLILKDCPLP